VGGEGLRYGRIGGRYVRYGWIGGRKVRVRGVYVFSSLVKQNKKGEKCAVFCFAGKRKLLFYILRCDYMGKSCGSPEEAGLGLHCRSEFGQSGTG
jgi:hypothetical protein